MNNWNCCEVIQEVEEATNQELTTVNMLDIYSAFIRNITDKDTFTKFVYNWLEREPNVFNKIDIKDISIGDRFIDLFDRDRKIYEVVDIKYNSIKIMDVETHYTNWWYTVEGYFINVKLISKENKGEE